MTCFSVYVLKRFGIFVILLPLSLCKSWSLETASRNDFCLCLPSCAFRGQLRSSYFVYQGGMYVHCVNSTNMDILVCQEYEILTGGYHT